LPTHRVRPCAKRPCCCHCPLQECYVVRRGRRRPAQTPLHPCGCISTLRERTCMGAPKRMPTIIKPPFPTFHGGSAPGVEPPLPREEGGGERQASQSARASRARATPPSYGRQRTQRPAARRRPSHLSLGGAAAPLSASALADLPTHPFLGGSADGSSASARGQASGDCTVHPSPPRRAAGRPAPAAPASARIGSSESERPCKRREGGRARVSAAMVDRPAQATAPNAACRPLLCLHERIACWPGRQSIGCASAWV
jgi:hypothetical protein